MARNYQTKTNKGGVPDSIVSTKFGAGEFNSVAQEIENLVTRSGQTLAPNDGTGEVFTQMAESAFLNGTKAQHFQDGGSANVIELTPVSGASGVKVPTSYANMDGAHITFFAAADNTGATTLSLGQTAGTLIGAKSVVREDGSALSSGDIDTTIENEVLYDLANDRFVLVRGAGTQSGDTAGLIQTVYVQDGNLATGTTQIPVDDTIPQITEGNEYITATITPTNAAHKLKVTVIWCGASSVNSQLAVALFKDSDADALVAWAENNSVIDTSRQVDLVYGMTAGTTSPITFRVRAGSNAAGTVTFNGRGGTRSFGGRAASSISIEEFSV